MQHAEELLALQCVFSRRLIWSQLSLFRFFLSLKVVEAYPAKNTMSCWWDRDSGALEQCCKRIALVRFRGWFQAVYRKNGRGEVGGQQQQCRRVCSTASTPINSTIVPHTTAMWIGMSIQPHFTKSDRSVDGDHPHVSTVVHCCDLEKIFPFRRTSFYMCSNSKWSISKQAHRLRSWYVVHQPSRPLARVMDRSKRVRVPGRGVGHR